MPGYHQGSPRNKGFAIRPIRRGSRRCRVMRAAGDGPAGARLRTLMVILWRAGCESARRLTSRERPRPIASAILIRRGRRQAPRVGMDHLAGINCSRGSRSQSLPSALALRHPRSDSRKALEPSAAASNRRTAALAGVVAVRPSSAAPRSCSRDGPARASLGRDPASARARNSRSLILQGSTARRSSHRSFRPARYLSTAGLIHR